MFRFVILTFLYKYDKNQNMTWSGELSQNIFLLCLSVLIDKNVQILHL